MFVDLDSARRFKRPPWSSEKESSISFTRRSNFIVDLFTEFQMRVTSALVAIYPKKHVVVTGTRIYHGWHRGTTPTEDRRVWEKARMDFSPYVTSRASYLPDLSFGNELICGGARVPLFDTLRSIDGVERQKLVDTALVADLLCYTRTESSGFGRGRELSSIGLVVADDDDLLPGIFVAESWGLPIKVLRVSRGEENRHLKLSGLMQRL